MKMPQEMRHQVIQNILQEEYEERDSLSFTAFLNKQFDKVVQAVVRNYDNIDVEDLTEQTRQTIPTNKN